MITFRNQLIMRYEATPPLTIRTKTEQAFKIKKDNDSEITKHRDDDLSCILFAKDDADKPMCTSNVTRICPNKSRKDVATKTKRALFPKIYAKFAICFAKIS